MTYSQKYCLVYFVGSVGVGDEFVMTDWPLHVTLADIFAIDLKSSNIESKIMALAENLHPVQVVANADAILGTAHVVMLQKSSELTELHKCIMDLLERNGATFNTPEFTRDGFLPHCTIQPSGRLYAGDELTIDSVALVDMFPGGDWQHRRIIGVFRFGGRISVAG